MKFLIIGDLHGHAPKIKTKDFDAIIAPGDFCSDGLRKYYFQALKTQLKHPKKKITLEQFISKSEFKLLLAKSARDGRKILTQLNKLRKPIYTVPGNWERDEKFYKQLTKDLRNIINTHHRKVTKSGLTFIGHGFISGPEFPQHKKELKQYSESELKRIHQAYLHTKKKLETLFNKAPSPIIFLPHNVPYNTPLDKITDKQSPHCGEHFGSVIAKELIQKYQPLLCIGGHMHEHHGQCKIGKTIVINAGFGPQRNTIVEIEKGKIKKIKYLK